MIVTHRLSQIKTMETPERRRRSLGRTVVGDIDKNVPPFRLPDISVGSYAVADHPILKIS
jgi:hypothetical protein